MDRPSPQDHPRLAGDSPAPVVDLANVPPARRKLQERIELLCQLATARVTERAEERSIERHAKGVIGATDEEEHLLMIDDWLFAEEELCEEVDRAEANENQSARVARRVRTSVR